MVEGEGYAYMSHPHTLYPPGLPLLLAFILGTFGPAYGLMRGVMLLFALSGAAAAYFLAKPRVGRGLAALVALLFAVSFPVVDTATFVLSDIPFAFLVLITLAVTASGSAPPRGAKLLGLAALILAAIMMRTVGTLLAAAVLAHGLTAALRGPRRRESRSWIALGLLILIPAGTWIGWTTLVKVRTEVPEGVAGSSSNFFLFTRADPRRSDLPAEGIGDYAARVRRNISYYSEVASASLIGSRDLAASSRLLRYPVILILLLGFARACKRRVDPAEIFLLLYLLVLLFWPYSYQRFLIPVLPLLYIYAAVFVQWAAGAVIGRIGRSPRVSPDRGRLGVVLRPAALTGALVLLVGALHLSADLEVVKREQARPNPMRLGSHAILAAGDWLSENTGEDEVVVAFQAAILHWLSHRRVLVPPWHSGPEKQLEMIRSSGARWIVINPLAEAAGGYMRGLVESRPDAFDPVAEIEGAEIWRVRLSTSGPGPLSRETGS
jgi:4-amino-4-deoxy-L-arabinose transferase-like glycosyltransferase